MPYFSRMSVTFFKNGLKWLGYMYIKGFWAELASYRNLKSNRVSGKCGRAPDNFTQLIHLRLGADSALQMCKLHRENFIPRFQLINLKEQWKMLVHLYYSFHMRLTTQWSQSQKNSMTNPVLRWPELMKIQVESGVTWYFWVFFLKHKFVINIFKT